MSTQKYYHLARRSTHVNRRQPHIGIRFAGHLYRSDRRVLPNSAAIFMLARRYSLHSILRQQGRLPFIKAALSRPRCSVVRFEGFSPTRASFLASKRYKFRADASLFLNKNLARIKSARKLYLHGQQRTKGATVLPPTTLLRVFTSSHGKRTLLPRQAFAAYARAGGLYTRPSYQS